MLSAALIVATLPPVVARLTRNEWDHAPVCPSLHACVTQKTGNVIDVGIQRCDQVRCILWPVIIQFDDGKERRFEFEHFPLLTFFQGGQRNFSVVPDPAYGPAPVIARFHGRHLVGFFFPTKSAGLATNDYPNYNLNGAALSITATLSWVALILAGNIIHDVVRSKTKAHLLEPQRVPHVPPSLPNRGEAREYMAGLGYLGGSLRDVASAESPLLSIPVVTQVVSDGPASRAGLLEGDAILGINGEEMPNAKYIVGLIRKLTPGDRVTLKVTRRGETLILHAVVGKRPGQHGPEAVPGPYSAPI